MDRAKLIYNQEISNEQYNKLASLKAMCLEESDTYFKSDHTLIPKYTDDDHLIRLLIARKWVVKKSFEMWKKWVEWRMAYNADNIREEEIASELSKGKAYYQGYDKKGHPLLVVHTRRHFPKESNEETLVRYGIYLLEKGIQLAQNSAPDGKITVVWDRNGFTKKNYDKKVLSLFKKLVTLIQDNYAERLYKLIILYPNLLFRTLFAVIKPFLNARTKSKILVVTKLDQLQQEISPENLLIEHGGECKFVYSYKGNQVIDKFTNNWVIEANEEEEKEDTAEIMKDLEKEELEKLD